MMDILKDLYQGRITEEEACDLFDQIVDDVHNGVYGADDQGRVNIGSIMGMDKYEETAAAQSAPLSVISRWRYEGWPDKCCVTGESIDYKQWYWLVKRLPDGSYGLMKL